MERPDPPFGRTECACQQCVDNCKRQPGHLIPGDLERIAAYLKQPLDEVKKKFWSSEGAVVMDMAGRMFRIRTITPKFDRRKKRCVFLNDADLCEIHPVAPFGCAYADSHMSAVEWQPKGKWALQLIAGDEYQELRKTLDVADHYSPTRQV